jgi:ADP-ribose pyrophosphatase YjhB (NUDIX family)
MELPVARDGMAFTVSSNGGDWSISWQPPDVVPDGMPHGANAVCRTADDSVVLVGDGARWGWPGGRPEGDETWEQTMRREVLEEACAAVVDARLLGFSRGACLSGPEQGRTLVRSVWLAMVEVLPWEPRFEIAQRVLVSAAEVRQHLWIPPGFEPIYLRTLAEAGLL